jgi:hypothetical protein
MEVPSIKGVILLRSWSQLNQLREEGAVTHEQLEAGLEASEVELLDGKIEPTLWYPISVAASFGRVVGEVTGNESPSEWVQRGYSIAENILKNPNIASFFDGAIHRGENMGASLVKMSSLLLNFGTMEFEGNLQAFRIPFRDAGALPEIVRFCLQGVIQSFAERALGGSVAVDSERHADGTIVYSAVSA